ncbi:MAG: hypothetical protein O7A04_06630 [Acidobacteria bacterium]|nr:hypothetical protein [Acidobacteriota bacterium]
MADPPRLFVLTAALVLGLVPRLMATETAKTALSDDQRLLLGAAREIADSVADRVWPGWGRAEFEILLVTAEREILLGGSRRPEGFTSGVVLPVLGQTAERPRRFPPSLLATMPAFGLPPTVVLGTPEATGLGPTQWLQVLLHEHFHQWQMRDPGYYEATEGLDLAAGDTTGRWMLEYAFPYDDEELGRSWARLSRELAMLLRRPRGEDLAPGAAVFWRHYGDYEHQLRPADARYFGFQLWQEGVARFVELRVAQEAAAGWVPPLALAGRPGFEDFSTAACAAWEELFEELETPDLAGRRRISFYAVGAGMAMLLDRTEPAWKGRYEMPRFTLAPTVSNAR